MRAMHRGYGSGKRAGQVTRLHIIREHGPGELRGQQALCGTSAGPHRQSQPVIIDPLPLNPPDGLAWCPSCVGRALEQAGLLDDAARSLALAEIPTTVLRGWQ